MAATRTPRPKQQRTVRLVLSPGPDSAGAFCVTAGEASTYYAVKEIRCEIGGRGFAVHKLGMGDLYHVRVGSAPDCTCECLGFLRHGYCRHVLGLLALVEAGKV